MAQHGLIDMGVYTPAWCTGVKLVLPAILRGVDDSAWRTKQGSIELLGTMAYLAPKQLSTSLPTVVPVLGRTLSDPHPKVQASAKKALEEVSQKAMADCTPHASSCTCPAPKFLPSPNNRTLLVVH